MNRNNDRRRERGSGAVTRLSVKGRQSVDSFRDWRNEGNGKEEGGEYSEGLWVEISGQGCGVDEEACVNLVVN